MLAEIGAGTLISLGIVIVGAIAGYVRLQSSVTSLVDTMKTLEARIEKGQTDHQAKVERSTSECRDAIEKVRRDMDMEIAGVNAKIDVYRSGQHELEVKIARDYVSREMMTGLEERFEKAIERLGDRFDKAVDRLTRSERGSPPG